MNLREFLVFVLGFVLCVSTCTYGESSKCLTVYKEGGAPAVFKSPKCPRWKLPDHGSEQWSKLPNARCQTALHQGRRKSQEDRILCALDNRVPFPGSNGITEVTVGVVAVFDGHNGAEASEMASKLLLQYFTLHTFFLLDATFSVLSRKMIGLLPNARGQSTLRDLNWELDELNVGRSLLQTYTLFFFIVLLKANTFFLKTKLTRMNYEKLKHEKCCLYGDMPFSHFFTVAHENQRTYLCKCSPVFHYSKENTLNINIEKSRAPLLLIISKASFLLWSL